MGYGYAPHRMGMHPIGLALNLFSRNSSRFPADYHPHFDLVTPGIHDIDCSDRASMNGGRWWKCLPLIVHPLLWNVPFSLKPSLWLCACQTETGVPSIYMHNVNCITMWWVFQCFSFIQSFNFVWFMHWIFSVMICLFYRNRQVLYQYVLERGRGFWIQSSPTLKKFCLHYCGKVHRKPFPPQFLKGLAA